MSKNLQLTLDWNRPDLAQSEIFGKDDWTKIRVDKDVFEKALLKKDREEFVEMFLDQGIQVHKYLNHKKLKLLFERAEDREFFHKDPERALEKDFLATDLNRLIYKLTLTTDFIQPYELSMNSVGLYVLDPAVAERKALNCLIIWAVLMNRQQLAKVLWNRCDEPISIALICSNIDFGQMALGVLDISFTDSSAQAYSMLSKPLPDFNNKTPIQIAHESNYMNFIAHPCCQRWLTSKLFGAIQVRELDRGVFRIPYWMKIIASALLLFPMFIWITFTPSAIKKKPRGITMSDVEDENEEEEEEEESSDEEEESNIPASKSMLEIELNGIKKKRKLRSKLKSALKKKENKLPIWKRAYLLWTAPITKFWLTQMFYFIYLGIFCLAVLWPTCGNLYLDIVVWFWTAMILTELVRHTYLKHQIKYDFIAFIRMFLIFMISGGVTIQAVLYPNYPLGIDLVKRVLTRPLFAMFLTQISDLGGDPKCSHMYSNISTGFCAAEPEIQPIEKCAYSSLAGYLIVIQYLLICKLVMVTLLFAMFALTITKVDQEAGVIWKFQRYALIVEFEDRPSCPPPLTVLYYVYLLVIFIINKIRGCKKKCASLCTCCKQKDNYNYWKKCAKEYVTKLELEKKMQSEPQKQQEIIVSIQEDLRIQKKNWKRMNDRIADLERMMQSSRLYLENISHKLDKTDVLGVANVKGQIIHVAARQSPYPGTRFTRFPVFDKYVPWELFLSFSDRISRLKEEREKIPEEDEGQEDLPPLPNFSPVWNSVVTYKVDNITREVDRRSWMSHEDQPLRYRIDPIGLPLNPKGRTGIRGKGVLWRWGPNHVIKAVCTRWRRKYNTDYQPTGFLFVEGKRVLEFIAVRKYGVDEIETVYGLPGDALHGLTTPYSTLCESFMRSVMDDSEWETKTEFDQADMIQFFAQFSSQIFGTRAASTLGSPSRSNSQILQPFIPGSRASSRTSLRGETDSQGFSAALLYKGYVDDPRNTDNAWVEAEVWNFHYDTGDLFDMKIPEDNSVNWKECSPNVKIFGNEGAIVQEAARIHDAYH
ncbi:hypothetical protein KUTeg_003006 [Tegillarca granosa]|uniref:TRPM-like domain-containing protein n=1 Tax=Tegillarca granosa TaxID=220873 RepID=A0ABQ9FKV8_TEGGR|nr:hypothetical protein KUTeg_003006 [Tegillarca granosa]